MPRLIGYLNANIDKEDVEEIEQNLVNLVNNTDNFDVLVEYPAFLVSAHEAERDSGAGADNSQDSDEKVEDEVVDTDSERIGLYIHIITASWFKLRFPILIQQMIC